MDKPLTVKDLRFEPPSFPKDFLLKELEKAYGLTGELTPLAGERDQNHLVTTPEARKYVLKVAGPDEDREVVDYQIKTLQHVEKRHPSLNIPRNLNTLAGDSFTLIRLAGGKEHMMRLLSYLEGVPFEEDDVLSLEHYGEAGKFQGSLTTALSDFSHPSEGYYMPWDISQGLVLNPTLSTSRWGDVERLVVPLLGHFKNNVLPKMQQLRKQTIHNDAHTDNMLKVSDNNMKIQGVIDFSDIVYAPVIQDLSIPLFGFIGASDQPYATAKAYVKGYAHTCPLCKDELDVLYDLILLRGCLTLQLVDFRIANNDVNEQVLLDDYPFIVKRIENLLELDKGKLTRVFYEAALQG